MFDAAGQLLRRAAAAGPVVVILDDLHWADGPRWTCCGSSPHQPQPGALMLVGAYRPDEPRADIAAALADLATAAELVPLRGLSAGEVADLVGPIAGAAAQDHWARLVHERSGGHPFFARELCQLLAVPAPPPTYRPPSARSSAAGWPGCPTAAPRCWTPRRSPAPRCCPTCSPR